MLQGKHTEADHLYLRAIEIGEKTLGPDHLGLAAVLNNRALFLEKQVRGDRHYQDTGYPHWRPIDVLVREGFCKLMFLRNFVGKFIRLTHMCLRNISFLVGHRLTMPSFKQ